MKSLFTILSQGENPSFERIAALLRPAIPLLEELESTPQDSRWHAEGNVLIHTKMVLEQLYLCLESECGEITGDHRAALILAAVLHDIAKPLTTLQREIDEEVRLVSPKHEQRGRSVVAIALAESFPHSALQELMALIGYHNRLKLLVARDSDARHYHKLSRLVDLQLVYWLEIADMRGRECEDKAQQLEHLGYFRLFSEEYQHWNLSHVPLWQEPIVDAMQGFSDSALDLVMASATCDFENGCISTPEEAVAKSYGYRENFPEVVITVGISGCGKSTWVRSHLADHHLISLDAIRSSLSTRGDQKNNAQVVRIAKETLRVHLRAKQRVVWDATSLRIDFRSAIIDLAKRYGALVTIVAFYCAPKTLFKRDRTRKHPVGTKVLNSQIQSAQWPTLDEAHRTLDIDSTGQVLGQTGFHGSKLPYLCT